MFVVIKLFYTKFGGVNVATFWVKDVNGKSVEAQYLVLNGALVTDPSDPSISIYANETDTTPIGTSAGYYIVPAAFKISDLLAAAGAIRNAATGGEPAMVSAFADIIADFAPGAPLDIQKGYTGGVFTAAYRTAASFVFGYAMAEAGIGEYTTLAGAGVVNGIEYTADIRTDAGGTFLNSPLDQANIEAGYQAAMQADAPTAASNPTLSLAEQTFAFFGSTWAYSGLLFKAFAADSNWVISILKQGSSNLENWLNQNESGLENLLVASFFGNAGKIDSDATPIVDDGQSSVTIAAGIRPVIDANGNVVTFTTDTYTYTSANTVAFEGGATVSFDPSDLAGFKPSVLGASAGAVWTLSYSGQEYTLVQYSDGTFGSVAGTDSAGTLKIRMSMASYPLAAILPGNTDEIAYANNSLAIFNDEGTYSYGFDSDNNTVIGSPSAVDASATQSTTVDSSQSQFSSTVTTGSVTQKSTYVFDVNGNTESYQGDSYDTTGALTETVSRAYTFDSYGNPVLTSLLTGADGAVEGIEVDTLQGANTIQQLFDGSGNLLSAVVANQSGSEEITYNNPNDHSIATITTKDPSGDIVSMSNTVDNGDGTETTTIIDPAGNVTSVSTNAKPDQAANTRTSAENAVLSVLQIIQAFEGGNYLVAADSALNAATAIASLTKISSTVLSDFTDGANTALAFSNFLKDVHDGDTLEAIRAGTETISDVVNLVAAGTQLASNATWVADAAAAVIDLKEGNYFQAGVDVIGMYEPETAIVIELAELFWSLTTHNQHIYVNSGSGATTLRLDTISGDTEDTVEYETSYDDYDSLTVDLNNGLNTVNAANGDLHLSADKFLGEDTISINNDSFSRVDTLDFDSTIASTDVFLEQSDNDLIFQTKEGGAVTVKDWFVDDSHTLSSVSFGGDGVTWTPTNGTDLTVYDTIASDSTVTASGGFDNIISTGTTSDNITIASGSHTTLISGGSGNLSVTTGQIGALDILTSSGNDTISVDNTTYDTSAPSNLDVIGDTGNEIINIGSTVDFQISTASGNDTINISGVYNDGTIDLGSGNNYINIDTQFNLSPSYYSIDLGSGNNIIVDGYVYSDYYYDGGNGSDTIKISEESLEQDYSDKKSVTFGSGITQADVYFSRVGVDLVVNTDTGSGSLTIANWFLYDDTRVGTFKFADGSSLDIDDLKAMLIPYRGDGDLEGWDGDDEIVAGTGNDTLATNGGSDVLVGGTGEDTFHVTDGSTATVYTGDGNDSVALGLYTTSTVHLGAGNDTVSVNTNMSQALIYGGLGEAEIEIGQLATMNTATIYAGQGAMTIDGDASYSSLVYGLLDGDVVVDDQTSNLSGADTQLKTLVFDDSVVSDDVTARQVGDDLVFSINGQSGSITIADWFANSDRQNMMISFANGTSVSAGIVTQAIQSSGGAPVTWNQLLGTSGSDHLTGYYAGEEFDGLGGNDYEEGTVGNDTFVFNAGYGSLEIDESTNNPDLLGTLQLGAGIDASNVQVRGDANGDFIITDGVSGDVVKVDLERAYSDYGIDKIQFSDGTVWSLAELNVMADTGTKAADTLYGTSGSESLDGKGGTDLLGGNGGSDTFVYDSGYGSLEINNAYAGGDAPVLAFGAGISAADLSGYSLRNGDDLVLTDGVSGDRIVIDNMMDIQDYGVVEATFSDGTSLTAQQLINLATTGTLGNDTLYGSFEADTFDGLGGHDEYVGGGGSDTFVYNSGYGFLEISNFGYGNSSPVLALGEGIVQSDIVVRTDTSGDLIITDGVDGDQILIDDEFSNANTGVESVDFSDGSSLSVSQLKALTTIGSTGADSITGTYGADLFDGRGGNDTINGNGGSDTFIYNENYGALEIQSSYGGADQPILELGTGITADDLIVRGEQNGSLVIYDGIAGDAVTIDNMLTGYEWGVRQVQFADGTSLSDQQLVALATTGTTGGDTLYGNTAGNLFDGKGGGDVEVGDGGNDTFVFDKGYGALEISEEDFSGSAMNVLQFGSGISENDITVRASDSGNLIVTDGVAGDVITVDYGNYLWPYGIQGIEFADGTSLTTSQIMALKTVGTSGADTIEGTSSSEYFDGRGGSDIEIGGGGNDAYALQAGYGALTVQNGVSYSDDAAGELSIIGADASNVWFRQVGSDLEVDLMGTDTKATLQGWFSSDSAKLASVEVSGGSDGTLTIDSNLNQLIQAMATFSSQNPGFDPTSTANPAISDSGLLAQVSADWHR